MVERARPEWCSKSIIALFLSNTHLRRCYLLLYILPQLVPNYEFIYEYTGLLEHHEEYHRSTDLDVFWVRTPYDIAHMYALYNA